MDSGGPVRVSPLGDCAFTPVRRGVPGRVLFGFISMTLVGELVCFGHGEVGDTSTIRSGDEASMLPLRRI